MKAFRNRLINVCPFHSPGGRKVTQGKIPEWREIARFGPSQKRFDSSTRNVMCTCCFVLDTKGLDLLRVLARVRVVLCSILKTHAALPFNEYRRPPHI